MPLFSRRHCYIRVSLLKIKDNIACAIRRAILTNNEFKWEFCLLHEYSFYCLGNKRFLIKCDKIDAD